MSEDSEKILSESLHAMAQDIKERDAEIERLRGLLREAAPMLPIYGAWKQSGGMLVRTEPELCKRIREALGDE